MLSSQQQRQHRQQASAAHGEWMVDDALCSGSHARPCVSFGRRACRCRQQQSEWCGSVTTIKVCKRRPAAHRCDVKAMSRSPPPRRRSPSPKDGGRARSRSPPAGDRDRDDGCKSLLVRNIPTDVRPQELKVEVFLCPAFCSWQFSWSFFSLGVTRICSPSLASSATSIAPTTTTRSSPSVSHSLNSSTAPTRPRRERISTAPRSSASPCQSRKRSMGARTGTTCVHGMLADMYSLLLRLHDESLLRCALPCQH